MAKTAAETCGYNAGSKDKDKPGCDKKATWVLSFSFGSPVHACDTHVDKIANKPPAGGYCVGRRRILA